MTSNREQVADGEYARKQIYCKDRLIAWSHRQRFGLALELAARFAGKHLLDFGSGDGTFLGMLARSTNAPAFAVGAEIDRGLVADCNRRFGNLSMLQFVHVDELDQHRLAGMFDAVFCMEVLEHVLDPEALLRRFSTLLKPDGTLVISVPVETGVPVLVKQIARRIAGWRGIADYPGTTGYSMAELFKSVFAGADQHIDRKTRRNPDGSEFYDHKGFNWMFTRRKVNTHFTYVRTLASPVKWLSPHLGSQAWFVASNRAPETAR